MGVGMQAVLVDVAASGDAVDDQVGDVRFTPDCAGWRA